MNLFEFINSKAKEGKIPGVEEALLEKEFSDSLIQLENDGVINLVGHRMAPTIRFCNSD